MNSIVRQCVQKWNRLPQWFWLAKNENVFKKTLNDFLLSQPEKNPLNSNEELLNIFLKKKTIERKFYNVIL